jgi:hypothetical protein
MIRWGNYKPNYYSGYSSQLFGLINESNELAGLIGLPGYQAVKKDLEVELRKTIDIEETDKRTREDQQIMAEKQGGEKCLLANRKNSIFLSNRKTQIKIEFIIPFSLLVKLAGEESNVVVFQNACF